MPLPIPQVYFNSDSIKPLSKFDIRLDSVRDSLLRQQRQEGYSNIYTINEVRGKVRKYSDKAYDKVEYERDSRLCWIVKKDVLNGLGIPDKVYYYIIYRTNWHRRWAEPDLSNVSKYQNTPGVLIDDAIITRLINMNMTEHTAITIGIAEVMRAGVTPKFYYCLASDATKFINKYYTRCNTPWHTWMCGLSTECFSERDPFRHLLAPR